MICKRCVNKKSGKKYIKLVFKGAGELFTWWILGVVCVGLFFSFLHSTIKRGDDLRSLKLELNQKEEYVDDFIIPNDGQCVDKIILENLDKAYENRLTFKC